ncbi:DUF3224 domain-containing protein [Pandoraea apista]|uniref:DUF3224 domain-containing protein n=1 Tax=Pandoraea apista TaxID=93218 RepID=A0A5E5PC80_9BURK|nr:DUF3224 domain-containing protein [Pandoraea apista]OXS92886.1 hypothetical protein B7H01_16385 [Pandoraea apista]VVG74182.1 hypothetical protein PAP18089_05194 [Pandoraea apista]
MNHSAQGHFNVQLEPQPLSPIAESSGLGRLSLNKTYHGDLQASSRGEMLSFRSSAQGSAGYVAMETVRGTLHGRSGTFVLQHSATMTRGVPAQSIGVVPDSGTDALSGISGSLVITITDGRHSYAFDYVLPERA